ncbi:Acetate kinase [compost metagenome]
MIFSGGIGENSPLVRKLILSGMEWCGVSLDDAANDRMIGCDGRIAAVGSPLDVFVLHTDEEVIIALETARIVVGG